MSDSPPSNAGIKFGNFNVIMRADGSPEMLGGGSYGKTYKATHAYLGTVSALKVIHDSFAMDAGVKKRFLAEARAIAQLKHPHIAQIVDCGEEDGTLYYAMEFCDGGDLERRMAQGPMPEHEALGLIRQAADALAYVHEQGFLHRDIKPSNIMLASAGPGMGDCAKVIDFGLVKQFSHENVIGVTQTGQFLGTMLFSSPEQLQEETLDQRSDIYSLGLTLWCLIQGGIPFPGKPAQVMAQRLSGKGYESLLPKQMTERARALLNQMLAHDRDARTQTMADVVQGIDDCLEVGVAADAPLLQLSAAVSSSLAKPMSPTDRALVRLTTTPELAAEKYNMDTEAVAVELGQRHRGRSRTTGQPVALTLVRRSLAGDQGVVNALEQTVMKASTCEGRFLLQPIELVWFRDHLTLVEEWAEGLNLLTLLRHRKSLSLHEASPILRQLAEASDGARRAGLPNLELAAHSLMLQFPPLSLQRIGGNAERVMDRPVHQWPPFLLRLAPSYVPEDQSHTDLPVTQAHNLTMAGGGDEDANVVSKFARLVYRIISGHQVPATAHVSKTAYINIPGLSEEGNNVVSEALIGETQCDDCLTLLERLWRVEAVPAVSLILPAEEEVATGAAIAPVSTPAPPPSKSPTARSTARPPTAPTSGASMTSAEKAVPLHTPTRVPEPPPVIQERVRPMTAPPPAPEPNWEEIVHTPVRKEPQRSPRPPVSGRPAVLPDDEPPAFPIMPVAIVLGVMVLIAVGVVVYEMNSTGTNPGKSSRGEPRRSSSSREDDNAARSAGTADKTDGDLDGKARALENKIADASPTERPAVIRELVSIWKQMPDKERDLALSVSELYAKYEQSATPEASAYLHDAVRTPAPGDKSRIGQLAPKLVAQIAGAPTEAKPQLIHDVADLWLSTKAGDPSVKMTIYKLFDDYGLKTEAAAALLDAKNAGIKEAWLRSARELVVAAVPNDLRPAKEYQTIAEKWPGDVEGTEAVEWLKKNLRVTAAGSAGLFKVNDPFTPGQVIEVPPAQWQPGGSVALAELKRWFRLPDKLPLLVATVDNNVLLDPFDQKPVRLPKEKWKLWVANGTVSDEQGRQFSLPAKLPPMVHPVAREDCDIDQMTVKSPFSGKNVLVSAASWKPGASVSENLSDAPSAGLAIILPTDLPSPRRRATRADGEAHTVRSPYGQHSVTVRRKADWLPGAEIADPEFSHLKFLMPTELPVWVEMEEIKTARAIVGEFTSVLNPDDGSSISVGAAAWKSGYTLDPKTGKKLRMPSVKNPDRLAVIQDGPTHSVVNPYTGETETWRGTWKGGASTTWGGNLTYHLPPQLGEPSAPPQPAMPTPTAVPTPQTRQTQTAEFINYTSVKNPYDGKKLKLGPDDWKAGAAKDSKGNTVKLPAVKESLMATIDDQKKKRVKNPFTGETFTWQGTFSPGERMTWGPFMMELPAFTPEAPPPPKPVKVVLENTIPKNMRENFKCSNGVFMSYSSKNGGEWTSGRGEIKSGSDLNETCKWMTDAERGRHIPVDYMFVPVEGGRVKAVKISQ